jgi:hypothetical protein
VLPEEDVHVRPERARCAWSGSGRTEERPPQTCTLSSGLQIRIGLGSENGEVKTPRAPSPDPPRRRGVGVARRGRG